jgi:hypothetical protein
VAVVADVADVAARQYSVVHLGQVRRLGVTDRQLERAVAAGELIRRAPEVYAIAGSHRSWHQDLMVAVLDAGPEAVVSHRAAAILHGIADRNALKVVEITVPRPLNSRIAGVVVHRSLDLSADHVMIVDGLPCTGTLRTLIDLGAVERWPVVADALERALQSGQATVLGAEWILTKLGRRGRDGCGVFRRVLDTRALKAASPHPGLLEPRMARVLVGLPPAEYQYKVFDTNGLFVAQVDFGYPSIKEAFEVDGFASHGTPEAMTDGFDRDHALRAAGWGVTHFTWAHVVRRPRYVREIVTGVLGAHGLL